MGFVLHSKNTDIRMRTKGHTMIITTTKGAFVAICVIILSVVCVHASTPEEEASPKTGQRWSRQVHNANGFINLAGSDWVPVQQFPTTHSVVQPPPQPSPASPVNSDRQSAARVLSFAPPHLQPQTGFYQQQQQQQPSQQQPPQQIVQQQLPHLNAIDSRPPPPHLPAFVSPADPFQLINGGAPHRFHVQQAPALQFHQVPAPISQQNQQFFSNTPQFHFQQQPQPQPQQHQHQQPQPQHQHHQQHQQHQQQQQHHHLPSQPQHHPQPQFPQHLLLSPQELNHQYQFPQFVQQQQQQQPQPPVHENVQLQAQPLQHVLQQQYEIKQGPPTFMMHDKPLHAVEQHHAKPQTEQLVQPAPKLYGQESDPKVRPNREHESDEEVQLLYVPLDTLYKQQADQRLKSQSQSQSLNNKPPPKPQHIKYNVQPVNPLQINNFYTATTPQPTLVHTPSSTPVYPSSPAYAFEGSTQRYSQPAAVAVTTAKPKIKPHQPPLAMFMLNSGANTDISVNEVLHALKNARNIDVLDSASQKAPKVFVGPSGLRTPSGYSKFELPYLSSIEQNRGVNKLPFFVAPLSYKAPKGFAKIPLPAPHVGSVVINSPPEVVQYEPVELPVQQQQHVNNGQYRQPQPQRTQSHPKKVQSYAPTVQVLEPAVQAYRGGSTTSTSTSKPKYGFMLGRDVFTTTAKPYYTATATPSPPSSAATLANQNNAGGQRYQFVSSTPAPSIAEQYSQFPEFSGGNANNAIRSHSQPTQTPALIQQHQQQALSVNDHSQRYQQHVSDPDSFVPMTTPKPSGRYESFGRFGQRGTPATTRVPQHQPSSSPSSPSTPAENHSTRTPFNYEQFVRPSAQPTVPTYTPQPQQHQQQFESDFTRFTASSPSTRGPTKRPTVSTSQPALSTYSSQQHEEEYSQFAGPSSTPSSLLTFNSPSPSSSPSSLSSPTPHTSNVQSEEYFNVAKPQVSDSFNSGAPNKTNTFATNLYNQFHPSKDYFSVPPVVTSSDSTASAPKPTEAENYSFVPLLTVKPVTPRPEVTFTSKPAEPTTRAQEIYNMKNYFREQNAFKNARPQLSALGVTATDEQTSSGYTAYERLTPSSTPQYVYVRSSTSTTTVAPAKLRTTTTAPTTDAPRETITYYTPSSVVSNDYDDSTSSEEPLKYVHNFKYAQSASPSSRPAIEEQSHREVFRNTESAVVSTENNSIAPQHETKKHAYSNHRESYGDPSPTANKVRQFDFERNTTPSSDVVHHHYNYATQSDDYNNLIRDAIKQNQAISSEEEDVSSNRFNLPSELPPISASLPGMVNSLYADAENHVHLRGGDSPYSSSTVETPTTTATTRRAPHRGRRPQANTSSGGTRATVTRAPVTRAPRTTTTTTTTVSPDDNSNNHDDFETQTRRPATTVLRGRRPIHYANRTTTSRTPTVRNPNRVRYNPTAEERQRVRSKQRTGSNGGKDEDLEYQRDVLKQNYPAASTRSGPTTAAPIAPTTAVSMVHETERYSSHYRAGSDSVAIGNNDYYGGASSPLPASAQYADAFEATTAGISSSTARSAVYNELPEHFSGLADHMQIPQEHQSLIGEYYNSESDIPAVEAINNGHPVFLTSALTTPSSVSTTEEVAAIQENAIESQRTRRPNFVRRPVTGGSRPVYNGVSSTTEPAERYTVRTKIRNDPNNSVGSNTPKPRNSRIRVRPSTTTTPDPETVSQESSDSDQSYQQISRFNKDFYQDAPRHRNFQRPSTKPARTNEQKRFKYDSFALDTQESQWSTKISDNSFHPVDTDEEKTQISSKSESSQESTEPEIVTAGSVLSAEGNGETYMLKVSASLDGKGSDEVATTTTTTSTPAAEKSFADLLGEAMSEIGNEIIGKPNDSSIEQTEEPTQIATTVPSVPDSAPHASNVTPVESSNRTTSGGKRRGVWKRVRVRPADNFETAESQNYGSRIFNSLLSPNGDSEKATVNKDTLKLGGATVQSFALDDLVDENEPRREILELETATTVPISTASSPGDIDLGTGAPVLAAAVDGEKPTASVTTTISPQKVYNSAETTTTIAPETDSATESMEKSDEPELSEAASPTAITTSTRRYDISEDDDLMMEDDHTDFPLVYENPFADEEVDTEAPLPQLKKPSNGRETVLVPTVSAFYDDYDTEFRTIPTTVDEASEAAPTIDTSSSSDEQSPEPTSSLISDVKQKLTDLFSFGGSEDYDYSDANVVVRPLSVGAAKPAVQAVVNRQQYTTIERQRPTQDVPAPSSASLSSSEQQSKKSEESQSATGSITTTEATVVPLPTLPTTTTAKSFHRNLMDSVIYATSTSTEVSHETEICYRGRCIKTEKKLH